MRMKYPLDVQGLAGGQRGAIRLNRGCGLIYPELEWEWDGDLGSTRRSRRRAESGRRKEHPQEWEHHSSVALQQRGTAATCG